MKPHTIIRWILDFQKRLSVEIGKVIGSELIFQQHFNI